MVSEKLPPRKLPPQKITAFENTPLWIFPLWKLPMWKLPSRIFPRENCPLWKSPPPTPPSPPEKVTRNQIPSPLINHINERKNKISKCFALKKAVQYNVLRKITKVIFDTQMISQKILGLDTFFTEWKKSKNRTKAQIAKWHLLASCTSQGELKLGSQIIKFGK